MANFFVSSSNYGMPVPYHTTISPPLSNGTQIHISGTPTGNKFEVNLKNHHNDVVLHFNPRFDQSTIVLNSAQRGSWGQEERHGLVFQRGVRFTLVIMVTDHAFNFSVNNSHICEFHHRLPMHSVHSLEIKGDITLESAQVYAGGMGSSFGFPQMGANVPYVQPPQPSFAPGGFNPNFGYPSAPPAVVVPTPAFSMGGSGVPSIQSCRIHTGSRIYVRGFVSPGAQRFELNLLQGYNDSDDIAFHFNPRFDQNQIVKNHRRNGQWGQEENQPFPGYMPLTPGVQIELQIACYPDKYVVYINNQPIAEYRHKIPPGFVMAVQYKGDFTVTSVGQV